jgi:hypothetical protein
MNINKFQILYDALKNNSLDIFLLGLPPYFFESKTDNEEPQNIPQAFDLLIIPYWKKEKNIDFPKKFENSIIKILTNETDINRSIYVSLDWICYFLYCKNEEKLHPNGIYNDLFEINLTEISCIIKFLMQKNKDELIADKRWGGADWNSTNGMWDPLIRVAKDIRDNLNGPDLVPCD